jgi:hypothetical protein
MAFRSFATRAMANLTLNSKLRLNSGHEIPILGLGVGGSCMQFENKITNLVFDRSGKRKSGLVDWWPGLTRNKSCRRM